ncbi:MAG: hypothetical protein NTX09_00055 [Verrucomicrobia bacterium]|nr:hypothetical protein [Verrucomicrobiota bacterium]
MVDRHRANHFTILQHTAQPITGRRHQQADQPKIRRHTAARRTDKRLQLPEHRPDHDVWFRPRQPALDHLGRPFLDEQRRGRCDAESLARREIGPLPAKFQPLDRLQAHREPRPPITQLQALLHGQQHRLVVVRGHAMKRSRRRSEPEHHC